ncbi:MAG: hypothetical protein JWO82_3849 [Akkermansiaceae bacterium]|nr:hypothetical protein [Akkermansiaceae bacterium]
MKSILGGALNVAALGLMLHATALAESPLEVVKAFQKDCAAKDETAALKRIEGAGESAGGMEGDYFRQKARRLVEITGQPERKTEAVAEKAEGDFAVVVLIIGGPGAGRVIEPLYLRKAGEGWRIIPFSNWRKLPLAETGRKPLEALEKWYEAEEQKRTEAVDSEKVEGG